MQVSFFSLSDRKKKKSLCSKQGCLNYLFLQAAQGSSFFIILQEIIDNLGPGVSLLLQMSGYLQSFLIFICSVLKCFMLTKIFLLPFPVFPDIVYHPSGLIILKGRMMWNDGDNLGPGNMSNCLSCTEGAGG